MASVDSEPTGSAPVTPARPRLRKGWIVGSVALVVLILDQLSKTWAVSRLSGFRTVHVIWTVDFQLAFNKGMSFSKGQGMGKLIAVVVIVIIGGLIWFARSIDNRWQLICIGAVIGGATGNLADRLFRSGDGFLGGHVVDFINPHWWPVFNVSDSAVVVGGIALAILLSFQPDQHKDTVEPVADGAARTDTPPGTDGPG